MANDANDNEEARRKKVARLRKLYLENRIGEVLIPDEPDFRKLVEDIASGSSEAEERANGPKLCED